MKILSFFFFTCIISTSIINFANAGQEPITFTKVNYLVLSPKDQKKFIQDLREVISLMDENSDFFAEGLEIGNTKISSFAQYFLYQKCLADDFHSGFSTNSKFTEASDMAFKEFIELNKTNKNSELTELQAARAVTATTIMVGEAHKLENSATLEERTAVLEKYKELKKQIFEYKLPVGSRNMIAGNESVIYKLLKVKEPTLDSSAKLNAEKKSDKKISKNRDKVVVKKMEGVEISDKVYSFSSCLYAGFVIQEKICKAPKTIPQNNILNQIFNAEAFKCDSTDQVICNPVLFGFDTDCNYLDTKPDEFKKCLKTSKPVCVPNSMTVTASCQEKTKADRYLQRAADLVTSKPDMIEDYIKSINQLCDEDQLSKNRLIYLNAKGQKRKNSEAIKLDIVRTCAVAIPKLNEVVTYYKNIKPESKSISTDVQKMKSSTKK